jgi:hypothetical protein
MVSNMKIKHNDVRRPALAKDGRKWKKRCLTKLSDIVIKFSKQRMVIRRQVA